MALGPDAFSSTYEGRPSDTISIGLRLLAESDYRLARASAARAAWDQHPEQEHEIERVETYNDAFMCALVASAACDPNNAREAYFQGDEEEVRAALTPEGVRAIFDRVESLRIERSPVQREASDEEIATLPDAMKRHLADLQPMRQRRLRRLLGFCLAELIAVEEAGEDDEVD